ncbi:MAG: cyclodehydratase [Mycobacteriaceae bacterium]|nr:cyclodehydratase [Mycobacteriaceae bacterium]
MGPAVTLSCALNPAMPVLLRPDGVVQVGWDPRRAVLVRPPQGMAPAGLAALLRSMYAPLALSELHRQANQHGAIAADTLGDLITQLVEAGVATAVDDPRRQRSCRSASIRVHGRGPLSQLLVDALRCSGAVITRSSQPHALGNSDHADLVVLSDYLVADPHMVRDLHRRGVAHLPVRVRDGTGLVGPLVVPGVTSCLGCADLHRQDRDPAWPAVAAQLRNTVGTADRATLLATAALALGQLSRVIDTIHGTASSRDPGPPPALSTTLEFDVHASSVVARHWPKHPLCSC